VSNHNNIIRIECDLADPYRPLVNLVTGGTVQLPRSRAVRFELGILDKGIWQDIVSVNFSGITLEVRPASRVGAALISKTVNAAAFAVVAEGQWNAKTGQHATVDANSADTGLAMGAGVFELELWLVITATKTTGGNIVTLAAGSVMMIEDGGQYSGNTPIAGDPIYYNTAQVDALIQAAMRNVTFVENGKMFRPTIDDNGIVSWDVRPA